MKKLILIMAGLAVLACSPHDQQVANQPAAAPAPVPDLKVEIPFKKFTLDNGLRVVVHEDRKAPVVAVSIWYHVGSKDEPKGKTGFAHLFEHLMFSGSENTDRDFISIFEDMGATDLNGTTWFDRTNYFATVPTPALERALWLESDRMGHLLGSVDQTKLDNQRGVVQNEKRQGDNQPYGMVEYKQLEALFPKGHPYRHSTIGSMEDLNNANLDDVRNWFQQYYGAANTVLVLAGDIDAETAKTLAETYFGDIGSGPAIERQRENLPTLFARRAEEIVDRKAPNDRLYRNWLVPGRLHEDATVLDVATKLVGDGKNSRLYKTLVRDKELASAVNASILTFELASIVEIQVDMLPGVSARDVSTIIDAEIAAFIDAGPTTSDVSQAKASFIADRVRGLEKVGGFGGKATALAQGELYAGDPAFYAKQLDWLQVTSAKNVRDMAAKWLTKPYYELLVRKPGSYNVAETGADRSAPPPLGDIAAFTFPDLAEARLDNGLKIVLARRQSAPVVEFGLHFNAGYAADLGVKLGTANVTLAMLDEGTVNRTALEIAADLERLGSTLGTRSDLDMSLIRLSSLAPNVKPSLDILADVLLNPAFDEEELDRFKTRWLSQIDREIANPVRLGLRELGPLLYGDGHNYGMPLTGSGTKTDIAALSRDDLLAFKAKWLRPDNATLFIVGDMDIAAAKALVQPALGAWKAPSAPLPTKNIAAVPLRDKPALFVIDKPGSPTTVILGGTTVPGSGAVESLALEVANDVFGGKFSSRINMNLREDKGWSYGAFSVTFDARGPRIWLPYAQVQADKTSESLKEYLKEIKALFGDQPITGEEFDAAIKTRVNGLAGSYETNGDIMSDMLASNRIGRALDHASSLNKAYGDLTPVEAQRAAASAIDPQTIIWLLVGDYQAIEGGLKGLGFDTITRIMPTE